MGYAIQRKVEEAIESALETVAPDAIASLTVYKGCSFEELTTPRIEIVAAQATPQIIGSTETGNWTVAVRVSVVTHKDDSTRDVHGARADAVGEVFLRSDMVTLLEAAGVEEFSCFEFTPGQATDSVDGSEIKSEYEASVFCGNIAP